MQNLNLYDNRKLDLIGMHLQIRFYLGAENEDTLLFYFLSLKVWELSLSIWAIS